MKKRKEQIAEAVHHYEVGVQLTKEERAWMDAMPERFIRKANDGKDFAILTYNPESKADEAMAERIAAKVKASGGYSVAFMLDDWEL